MALATYVENINNLDGGKDRKETTMKKRQGLIIGFAVLMIAAIFTLVGCDNGTGGDPGNGGNGDDDGTLTGSVSIGGIPKYTHRIWADTSLLGGNGTISYQWIRGASTSIGTGVYYDITAADIGQTLKVRVSRSEETGTKTSATVTPIYHNIGDEGPAGGIVFYDDDLQGDWLPSGKRFVEIAAQDVSSSLPWGLNGTEVNGPGSQMGNGKIYHDAAITAGAGTGTAAGDCEAYTVTLYNGALWERTFDDWFLPGLGEMAGMDDYQTKDQSPYSGLTYNNNNPGLSGKYWTSYSHSDTDAYYLGFGFSEGHPNAGSLVDAKTIQNKVRAIRWF
jgi:hypothetical protein